MSTLTLSDLSKKMQKIDIAMLSTHTDNGNIGGRPMSNNGEVEYDGTSYYFTWDESRTVKDIEKDNKVSLAFQGAKAFLVAVEGKAKLVRDRKAMEEHWTPDLDRWFKDGLDTPGVVMIQVDATRIHYWDGEEDGEVKL
ncbi:pyridoxamine 5'-phosphate oxidase family protein (plasmid) [Deinococcus sp. KNUC1210]|uniref:pyridoxamine 5'-phosphate oxidase family protein n=1 Tax=Deinococcus sp. KNUC1210 TaxID=2917691 RepID=UPI001EEFE955|nr:pyridoxamine 5'-phosphate oxidase family protein [Deinococcus sp. KNUC1210]ULH17092.1 pyridoxamine 5'-phosphate oxidase family protein [Deinococcus sp. KNUC1210]